MTTEQETKNFKQKEYKINRITASIIPLERLSIIRNNIKNFTDKWGVKGDKIDEINLSKLKHPNEFSRQQWLITSIQWVNRATSVVGGGLLLVGQSDTENPNSQLYTQTGGVIAIAVPFIETLTSYVNEQVYDEKRRRWGEFVEDTNNMLNSYHELLGIIKTIKISKFGKLSEILKQLEEASNSFLKSYGKDKSETIDVLELVKNNREKLAQDLSKKSDKGESSQLKNIVKLIKELEDEVIKYRQGEQECESQVTFHEQQINDLREEKQELLDSIKELEAEIEQLKKSTSQVTELATCEENNEQIAKTEIPPK